MTGTVRLFLCGDVMLGRGVDCIMPHPGSPTLHEEFMKSARDYVSLAERSHGPIPRPVAYDYVWGDALSDVERENVATRIINLETSITVSDNFLPKGINYRMHPANTSALTAAKVDCCVLANNHVLDWGAEGLGDTLRTLRRAGIKYVGAGMNACEASDPARIPIGNGGRIIVFGFALPSSGVFSSWNAGIDRCGVNVLDECSDTSLKAISQQTAAIRESDDLLIASIHWGGNWGYRIPREQRAFAHRLIDVAGFHLVHGHSSHHAKAMEIYRGHLILYGCGDFITDYEGISGYEEYRGDLSLAYLPSLSSKGELIDMRMLVYRLRRFLEKAPLDDVHWLEERLNRESAPFGAHVNWLDENVLSVRPS